MKTREEMKSLRRVIQIEERAKGKFYTLLDMKR